MLQKRMAAIVLVVVMLFALAACTGNNNNNTSNGGNTATQAPVTQNQTDTNVVNEPAETDISDIISDQTVNLTVYTQLANYSGEQIGWSAEIMLEKFNCKFNIINETDGMFATRMAAGDLGDIVIFGNDGAEYLDAVNAGMLYDWEEEDLLKEYGPYINTNMQTALNKNRELSGGKLYGFGHNVATDATEHEAFFYYPYIRWDLYAQLGYPPVNTLEDFVDVLADMVELEPVSETGSKTYGVSMFSDWDGDMVMFVKSTGALYGYDEFGFGLYDTKTQTYEDTLKEGGMYLRALKFYNTLYQRGLLNPDSMTQTFNDMVEDYNSGSAFFNIFSWMASGFNTPEHLASGKAMQVLAAADQKNIAYGLNVYGGNRVWTIGAKTHYPELCMAIINWFCTPEGRMESTYGPKGLTWDYNEAGEPFLTELGLLCQKDGENTIVKYGNSEGAFKDGQFQHNNSTWSADAENPDTNGFTYNWEFWPTTLAALEVTPVEQDWRDHTGALKADDYLEDNGHISIAISSPFSMAARSPELDTTWNQVKECIKNGSWSAIYANTDAEFDSIVATMIQQAKDYGYDECVAFTQEQALIKRDLENAAKQE